MSAGDVLIQPLTREAFAPYGDILELGAEPTMIINQGLCGRHHDLAKLDFVMTEEDDGRPGISLFDAEPRSLPYRLDLVERHPLGSQAFVPMSLDPFLVIVAPDEGGTPGTPLAFETHSGQGINFHRDVWHGVLTPLHAPGLFAVIDRIGTAKNLQEHWFERPYRVARA
ncbi:ureidoglycolate lyase [Cohaesibacter sp. ES.047]|uniref:ureidoglycolate lyase n=1 Tax=Cohaesibacter sp. ES.047 TaxID=1798205 RepID=UPI000BB7C270|nr:ureidoglycolate lyase [Cohaesibacter sp. ES.047]SNY90062.1 ureidoglycolate lyase [Cohaesibacter sp. ES.047]